MFTFFHGCGIPPVTITCPQGGAHAQNVGPTGWLGCTVPPNCLGPTAYLGCLPPTGTPPATVCPGGPAQAQAQTVPPHCVPNTIGCTAITPCPTINPPCGPQTAPPHCVPPTIGCTAITPCPTRTAQAQTVPPPSAICATSIGCTITVAAKAQNVGPTGWLGCTVPPNCLGPTAYLGCIPPTGTPPATVCPGGPAQAQNLGPTGTQGCTLPRTWFHGCGIPPVTLTCNKGVADANIQTTIGYTGWHDCTQITGDPYATVCNNTDAKAQNIGHTGWYHCTFVGPTGTLGCTQPTGTPPETVCPGGNAQAQNIGHTGWLGCHQQTGSTATICGPTDVPGCTGYQGCIKPTGTPPETVCPQPTYLIGCTGYQGCVTGSPAATVCQGGDAQAQTIGHTAYEGCGQHGTEATVCTQIGCGKTHLLGCTAYEGCHNDAQVEAQAQIHSIPVADCIPTRSCTGAWPVC